VAAPKATAPEVSATATAKVTATPTAKVTAAAAATVAATATAPAPAGHCVGSSHCHAKGQSRYSRNQFPPHRSLSFSIKGSPGELTPCGSRVKPLNI
jgi:hypothetical protein